MANYKVTLIFKADSQGWTETFYTVNVSAVTARAAGASLALARIPLLGTGSICQAVRTSDEAVTGDSYLSRVPAATNAALVNALPRDYQNTAILSDAYNTDLYRRQLWFRGLPDAWTVFDPTTQLWVPNPTALDIFNAIKALLEGPPWALRAISKADDDVRKGFVADVIVDGPYFTITVPLHGYSLGDVVRISLCRGTNMQYVNKTFRIATTPTANTFNVQHGLPITTGIIYLSGGISRRSIIRYPKIDRVQYNTVSSHDTGRAFFTRRGRRRARR